jgi:hypothetical protein
MKNLGRKCLRDAFVKRDRTRIIVLGYIIRGPYGGLAWHHLQYTMGFASLGHDVYFFEDSDDYPACCDPITGSIGTDPFYGLQFATDVFKSVGLGDKWAYYDAHSSNWYGPLRADALQIAATADLLLNVSGSNPIRSWVENVPIRVFVDTDPAFTQIRHLTDPSAKDLALKHTAFFTFGENMFEQDCSIPNDGFQWQATRQPICLNAWTVTPGASTGRFTTVMQWDSYASRQYAGKRYGMKSASFSPFLELPKQTSATLELALGSETAPRDDLRRMGWYIVDPTVVVRDIWAYQQYISSSSAEFAVAKHGYVSSRSGWFSERSAAYLASGRPVVTQETGFSRWLKAGAGVLAFSTPEEALNGIEEVCSHYELQSHVAREIAEEYFDARKVLRKLLHDVGA